jgi:hypothetical protein
MERGKNTRKIDRNYGRKMTSITQGQNQIPKAWQNWCKVYVTTADEKAKMTKGDK